MPFYWTKLSSPVLGIDEWSVDTPPVYRIYMASPIIDHLTCQASEVAHSYNNNKNNLFLMN